MARILTALMFAVLVVLTVEFVVFLGTQAVAAHSSSVPADGGCASEDYGLGTPKSRHFTSSHSWNQRVSSTDADMESVPAGKSLLTKTPPAKHVAEVDG